jgi:hypothetical protein
MPPKNEKKPTKSNSPGCGLDIGTMNVVSARRTGSGVETKRMRDAFLDFPLNAKRTLRMSNVSFVEREDEILILGDAAMEMANVFGKEARRPLSDGLISPSEVDSLEVLGLLISNVLGKPTHKNEVCYFSVPAPPIDRPGKDIIYHTGIFERIVSECGYEPYPSNEAMALIYSETAKEGFSGVALSFGAGLVNCALAVNTLEGLSFAVNRAGDWIDRGAANSVGSTQARICAIKEGGIDINDPQGREQEAIAFYYKAMIEYSLDHIAKKFKEIQNQFALPKPIPIVVSGGSSMVGGFLDFFMKVFEKKRKRFPIEISEIRAAKEPLNAVAYGMLIQAMQEYTDD